MATDYTNIVRREIIRMATFYKPLLDALKNENTTSVDSLKEKCNNFYIRLFQQVEHIPFMGVCLANKLPVNIVNIIAEYLNLKGSRGNMILCTWHSDICEEITKANVIGYPPWCLEYRDPKMYTHRDDIDVSALHPQEKVAYDINSSFMDEILSTAIADTPDMRNIGNEITLFSGLCIDGDHDYWIELFFFVNTHITQPYDYCIEFMWRMDIAPHLAEDVTKWMHRRNIEVNVKTGEVIMVEYE